MSTTFAQLGVPPFITDALERRGITEPFEIQAVTIADMLAGRDVLGRAPTGSGKTLAFGVPIVTNIEAGPGDRAQPRKPRALILAPTRELAEQITTELRSFCGRLRIDAVYGGVGYGAQLTALKRGIDILVACPGRLEDLIQRRDVDLSQVRYVVLDEADRMADMGFMPSVRRLLDRTPSDRQTVLFSATLDGDVAKLTKDYQRDPVRHEVGEETPDVKSATHRFWKVDRNDRNDVLAEVVKAAWPTIIFCRTRHGADRLAKQLARHDVHSVPIHGGLSQSQRNRSLDAFSAGRAHALIATDVAARGIHVDGVASVVHYDPPEDHKAYIHRSGRTARAGAAGVVVSLVQPEQMKDVRRMQRDVGIDEQITAPDVRELPLGDLDATRTLAPAIHAPAPEQQAPRRQGNGGGGGQRQRNRPARSGRDDQRGERAEYIDRSQAPRRGEPMPTRVDREGRPVLARTSNGQRPAGNSNGNGGNTAGRRRPR